MIRKLIPSFVGLVLLVSGLIGTRAATPDENDTPSVVKLTVMSQELLEGIPIGKNARLLHVQGDLRAPEIDWRRYLPGTLSYR